MTRTRRPSAQTVAILRALAADPDRWRYGYDLCTELGLQAGSMYPILIRLADRGLLETSWETERVPGRPARHLYRLTAAGREYAAATEASERDLAAARNRPNARNRAAALRSVPEPAVPGLAPGPATGAPARGRVQPRWEGA